MFTHLITYLQHVPLGNLTIYLILINGLTFLTYRYDKRAAIERRWRIPESTLHMMMLMGGTIGAFAAQRLLRHKNRKTSFQIVFWLLCAIQCVIIRYAFA